MWCGVVRLVLVLVLAILLVHPFRTGQTAIKRRTLGGCESEQNAVCAVLSDIVRGGKEDSLQEYTAASICVRTDTLCQANWLLTSSEGCCCCWWHYSASCVGNVLYCDNKIAPTDTGRGGQRRRKADKFAFIHSFVTKWGRVEMNGSGQGWSAVTVADSMKHAVGRQ